MANEVLIKDAVIISTEGSIQFKNFNEIKENIKGVLKKYEGLTLTDDNKQFIKSEKAQLNKVSKALNNERISVKKEYMKPLDLLEKQVKEITELIKGTVDKLDDQVKFDEDWEKAIKENGLRDLFKKLTAENHEFDFIKFEDMNLNITLSVKEDKLKEEIDAFIEKVALDLQEINTDVNRVRLMAKYRLSKNLQQSRIQLNQELAQEMAVVPDDTIEQSTNSDPIEVLEFTVSAPKSKIKALIEYLEREGINYLWVKQLN